MTQAFEGQWNRVCARLRAEFGDAAFNSWLKPLSLHAIAEGRVQLGAPTQFMRNWVVSHYGERIRSLWQTENTEVRDVEIVVHTVRRERILRQSADQRPPVEAAAAAEVMATPAVHETVRVLPSEDLGSALDPRFRFDNFVIGKSNELAHAAARRVAESSAVTFNPLFLYGGVGLGKTHLMHAIAWDVRERDPSRKVLYLSAEKFMYQFIRALRDRDAMTFKQVFRSVDVLLIDDVQFFSRKDSTQEEFFHTFNELYQLNRQIVLSSDAAPSEIPHLEERLTSRFQWGLVANVSKPSYETRLAILHAKSKLRAIDVPEDVISYIATKIDTNARELEGAITTIQAHAHLSGRPIDLALAREALGEPAAEPRSNRVTLDNIIDHVTAYYGIKLSDLQSRRRHKSVTEPRQVCMWLARQRTRFSLEEIGGYFGGRDHTTVMHSIKTVEQRMGEDRNFAAQVEQIDTQIENVLQGG